jgi:hypothetical protein
MNVIHAIFQANFLGNWRMASGCCRMRPYVTEGTASAVSSTEIEIETEIEVG